MPTEDYSKAGSSSDEDMDVDDIPNEHIRQSTVTPPPMLAASKPKTIKAQIA